MNDITVIIPVHEWNESVENLLSVAVKSVPKDLPIIISTTKTIENDIKKFVDDNKNIDVIFNYENEKHDFCTLTNNAVLQVGTKWFSILEFDDEYADNWFIHVEKELNYKSDVSVFLPLIDLVDINTNKFYGYANEAPWASSFSEEIGYIDHDSIQDYFDFNLTGCVFNTEDFKNIGMLKPSIKISFWYEFVLRCTNSSKKLFVVPKLGYKHSINREGSLIDFYQKTITAQEAEWWRELAKREYFYNMDRNKTYESENNEEGI